jgi:hypothetical protein
MAELRVELAQKTTKPLLCTICEAENMAIEAAQHDVKTAVKAAESGEMPRRNDGYNEE